MAEILSPEPTKLRTPAVNRLQSPKSPFFIGSNDDQLERTQARTARAAAVRRKYLSANTPPPRSPSDNCLHRDQIIELLQNCIKLASENKINQKNTWELKLIDHLSEIFKVETENDSETNFRKASCTLEAVVKIYSLRVDSVHSEAYKILGRIIRAGGEDVQGTMVEGGDSSIGPDEGCSKKEKERKAISPLATLEPSFEALNMKKFDAAFAVDPLYHQTSAKFDEGGAKGLLLNNLGVYGGCKVLFDSYEVPRKCILHSTQDCTMDVIDLSFVRDYIEKMLMNMAEQHEISPTLREIVCQGDENGQRSSNTLKESQEFLEWDDSTAESNVHFDSNLFQNFEAEEYDNEGRTGLDARSFTFGDKTFSGQYGEDGPFISHESDVDGNFEELNVLLFQDMAFLKKPNAWARPEHWKYRKPKGAEDVSVSESQSGFTTKRSPSDKPAQLDIYFMKSLDEQMPDFFAPPKNPIFLLLPANRVPPECTLPEDIHYEPENLVRLFLCPSVKCFARGKRKTSGKQREILLMNKFFRGIMKMFLTGSLMTRVHRDVEDLGDLVSCARQVNKIEVIYDRTSKLVDEHVLKETLWQHIQETTQVAKTVYEGTLSFKDVLASFPDDCQAAPEKDISPHLCFICLLHLANEHNLSIYDCPTLDDLKLQFPSSWRKQNN